MKVKSRSFLILVVMLMLGTLTFQACLYYSGPGYYEPLGGPVLVGDYDEFHVWHDRYWWISNRHEWVHQHHPEWVEHETPEEHQAYEHHR